MLQLLVYDALLLALPQTNSEVQHRELHNRIHIKDISVSLMFLSREIGKIETKTTRTDEFNACADKRGC